MDRYKRSEAHVACRAASICILSVFASLPAAAQGLKPSDSIPQLEAAVARDSNDAQLHYRLGIAYWSRKRFDEAGKSLLTAVTIERRFADAYLALAYLPYARRRQLMKEAAQGEVPPEWRDSVVESERLRRRAFLINPLVDLKIMGAFVPVRTGFVAALVDPFSSFVSGNYAMAYLTFNRWVGDRPRDSIPDGMLWFHGLAAGHVALYDVAATDFQALVDRSLNVEHSDTMSPIPLRTNDFRYLLATFKNRGGHFPEAIALYKEALGNDAGLFMAHVQMGKIFEQFKQWPDAIEHFEAAVATNPDDPSVLLDLGVIFREAGRLQESESTLNRAMGANPRDSRVPYHLAITLQQESKVADARAAFTHFLEIAPSRYATQISDARVRLASLQ